MAENTLKPVTGGRAVADIKQIYIHKFVNGAEPTINATFLETGTNWFGLATLKGTVNVTQDDVSKDKIMIDQSSMPIGITTEPGDFNFEATLPSMAKADLEKWLSKGTALSALGKSGQGYKLDGAQFECSVMIITRTDDVMVFPHTMISVAFNKEDKVFTLKLSGMVLAATATGNDDVYVLADAPEAWRAEYTIVGGVVVHGDFETGKKPYTDLDMLTTSKTSPMMVSVSDAYVSRHSNSLIGITKDSNADLWLYDERRSEFVKFDAEIHDYGDFVLQHGCDAEFIGSELGFVSGQYYAIRVYTKDTGITSTDSVALKM